MYEELVKRLKHTASLYFALPTDGGDLSLTRLLSEAVDAREGLNKRIDFLLNCVYEAEDSLDRGADNDWARAALEKAERGQDDV